MTLIVFALSVSSWREGYERTLPLATLPLSPKLPIKVTVLQLTFAQS